MRPRAQLRGPALLLLLLPLVTAELYLPSIVSTSGVTKARLYMQTQN